MKNLSFEDQIKEQERIFKESPEYKETLEYKVKQLHNSWHELFLSRYFRTVFIVWLIGFLVVALSGCQKEEQLTSFQIQNNTSFIMYETMAYTFTNDKLVSVVNIGTIKPNSKSGVFKIRQTGIKIAFQGLPTGSPYYDDYSNVEYYIHPYFLLNINEFNEIVINNSTNINTTYNEY